MAYKLGLIGAGNMAEAIARAAIAQKTLAPSAIIAADPSADRLANFSRLGITTATDNAAVIEESQQVLIAVKPQVMAAIAADLGKHGRADLVVLSIMAGITTEKLAAAIGDRGAAGPTRIVRIMPNTPLQVGYGMAGIALGRGAQPGDEALALRLFQAAGRAVVVDESQLDAITAVSGSGPAYVFYLAEAMQRAATELGLGEHAGELIRQTLLGAAHLLDESDDSPAQLREKVTSPGGTTEAAIKHLEASHAGDTIVAAVKAAADRSRELGE